MNFKQILNLLFGNSDSMAKYRKMEKALVNDIKGSRYKDFYNVFSRSVSPDLALYFYKLYKACSSIKIERIDGTSKLKNAVLRHFLNEKTYEIVYHLKDSYLIEHFKPDNPKLLSRCTEKNISDLNTELNSAWQNKVDQCYDIISSFTGLINFDYYSLLKHFAPQLEEHSFSIDQKFLKVKAEIIIEDLKDFMFIAEKINTKDDWETAFSVLNKFSNKANIQPDKWMHTLKNLEMVLSSTILEMIIRHASSDLCWRNTIVLKHEKIAQQFLSKITKDARKVVQDILVTEKERNVNSTVAFIFGGDNVQATQFYTEIWDESNKSNITVRFKYVPVFNYCMLFMSVFFERIKKICNSSIIYGVWVNANDMHNLSNVLHDITILSIQISACNASLSELEERDPVLSGGRETNRTKLYRYIDSINDEVFTLIRRMIHDLSYISTFFLRFETKSIDANLENGIKNIKELSKLLIEDDCNIPEIREKIVVFLRLLDFLEFETDDTGWMGG
jgi:hypothetical protein